ncbi:hypothetical protein [Halolamina rubra]|uniref:hypothetical protein n=1 Tax=Halolamina rubra TaxID=1380430 RepID=UPI0012ABB709|nr:hypothetical protein [Halolamina rubra]
MTDVRRRLRSVDLPSRGDVTVRSAFRWGSRLLFIGVFLVAVMLSFAADAIAVGYSPASCSPRCSTSSCR